MGATPESAGPILGLWIFAAAAGNLFALYWLLQAFFLSHPALANRVTQRLRWRGAKVFDGLLILLRPFRTPSKRQQGACCVALLN